MKIVVSGTPGVGKHTISYELSKLLDGAAVLDINKVILSENLFISTSHGCDVDVEKTCNSLKSALSSKECGDTIIVGHLAPYVVDPQCVDLVIVLRRNPAELVKIYETRGYSKKKTRDNLVSEMLGIISHDFLKKFSPGGIGEVEVKENVSPAETAQNIVDMYANKSLRRFGTIDWLPVVQADPRMVKFLV